MSEMQHERIKTLCDSLHFLAVPEVYANLAAVAAQEKSSFVDYLEAVLRSEHDLRRDGHGRPWPDWPAFRPSKRWTGSFTMPMSFRFTGTVIDPRTSESLAS